MFDENLECVDLETTKGWEISINLCKFKNVLSEFYLKARWMWTILISLPEVLEEFYQGNKKVEDIWFEFSTKVGTRN